MAQPWPACTHTMDAAQARSSAKSASSRTIMADLPPSSRKTRFRVAAPFSMMRLPVAVEPVNEIRSTRGRAVSSSPTRWSDEVTTLTTPAGMSVFSATSRPSRVAFHGVSGAGLRTVVLPVARTWAELVEGDLEREVPRDDGADDARSAPSTTRAAAAHAEGLAVGQRALPRELVDHLGRPAQRRRRAAQSSCAA